MNVFDKAHEKAIKSYINRIKAIMDKYTEEYCKHANSAEFDADKPFSFDDYPATLSKVKSLEAKMAKELQVSVEDGVADSWAMSNRKNDALVKSSLSAMALEGMGADMVRRYFNENRGALDAFKQRVVNGMNLSQRVWKITEQNMQEMEGAIDIALRDGTSAAQLSRKVRGLLNEPDKLFRRVRDEHGVLHLSKNAKAYHPGQGVYRSSYKNAIRLAGTEINMAYRTADHLRYQQLDFVVGIEILTSPTNHPDPDICDELKGKYPKDFKFTGWHPNCRCHVETILKTEQEMDADDAAIRSGGRPSTGSVNTVKDMPDQFERWLRDNEERIARANSLPYFLRDNYTITPGADGSLTFERIVSLSPAVPAAKSLLDIAAERHAARTPEQIDAIKAKAAQRHDAYELEKIIRKRYEDFKGFDLDKELPKFNGDYAGLSKDLSALSDRLEKQLDTLNDAGILMSDVKSIGITKAMDYYDTFKYNMSTIDTNGMSEIDALYAKKAYMESDLTQYTTNSIFDRIMRMMYDTEIAKTESAIAEAELKIKIKLQNEKTEERWADLTNSQRKEYVLKWIQDERVVNKEFDNYLKKTGFIKDDIVITEEGYFDEKTHSILSLAKKRIIDNELKIYNHYVGTSESFDINRALYTNKGLLPKELFEKNAISKTQLETINALDESIQNSKIGIPMKAYRMAKKDEINDVFGVNIDMSLSNDEIAKRISARGTGVNYGFTSASTNPDLNVFTNRPFIYEINIPKGSRCYVTKNSYESEIILPRQSKYKINSVRYDNKLGKVVINVDVIQN